MQRASMRHFGDERERIRNHESRLNPGQLQNYPITKLQMLLVVHDPFALQLLKKNSNVRANLLRIRLPKFLL